MTRLFCKRDFSRRSHVLSLHYTDILQQATALSCAHRLHLLGAGCSVQAVVKLIAQGAASEKSINFTLALTVTFDYQAGRAMHKANAIVRLVHLLAALTAATHKSLLQIPLVHPESFHALEQLVAFLRRDRHNFTQSPHPPAAHREQTSERRSR